MSMFRPWVLGRGCWKTCLILPKYPSHFNSNPSLPYDLNIPVSFILHTFTYLRIPTFAPSYISPSMFMYPSTPHHLPSKMHSEFHFPSTAPASPVSRLVPVLISPPFQSSASPSIPQSFVLIEHSVLFWQNS